MSVWSSIAVAGITATGAVTAASVPVAFQLYKLRQENTAQHAEGRQIVTDGLTEIKSAIEDHSGRLGRVEEVVFGPTPRSN